MKAADEHSTSAQVSTSTGQRKGTDRLQSSTHDIARVRAEIEAEAEELRLTNPSLSKLERDIERIWADIAPIGATGDTRELLLHRIERLSVLDANAPVGSRLGIRQIKLFIRKAIYWHVRYVVDALNVFTGLLTRLLRHFDDRLVQLENATHVSFDDAQLLDAPEEVSIEVADLIAGFVVEHVNTAIRTTGEHSVLDSSGGSGDSGRPGRPSAEEVPGSDPSGGSGDSGRCLVLSCGDGTIVDAISRHGGSAYGVDYDPCRILSGVQAGLDLRSCDVSRYPEKLEDGRLGALVLTGIVETFPLAVLWRIILESKRVLQPDGIIVVAVADPQDRDIIEADIRAGRGIAAATWSHLLKQAGFSSRLVSVPGQRVLHLVIATSEASASS